MKSFKEYIEKKSISEMAHAAIKFEDDDNPIVEIKKTPIFFDEDDINYLKQIPSRFWASAIQKRYGELLYNAWNKRQNNQKADDVVDLTFKDKTVVYKFKNIDTKINDLYEKLSGDDDPQKYANLSVDDLDDEKASKYFKGRPYVAGTSYKFPRRLGKTRDKSRAGETLGPYAFNFNNFKIRKGQEKNSKKQEDIYFSDGYVSPDKSSIRKALDAWKDYVRNNFDDEDSNPNVKVWKYGIDFTTNNKKNKEDIVEEVPKLVPGKVIFWQDNEKKKSYEQKKEFINSWGSESDFSKYAGNILNYLEFSENSIIIKQEEYEKLKKDLNKPGRKGKQEEILSNIKKLLDFISNDLKYFNDFIKKELENSTGSNREQILIDSIFRYISNSKEVTKNELKELIKSAKLYNVHQWNVMQHNRDEMNPLINTSAVGAIYPNNQQVERIYGAILNILGNEKNLNNFFKHIVNDIKFPNENYNFLELIKSTQLNNLESRKIRGNKFQEAMFESFLENINIISKETMQQIKYKLGSQYFIKYAQFYKKYIFPILNKGKTWDDVIPLLRDKRIQSEYKKHISFIKKFIYRESVDYLNQITQLYSRFKDNKFNRFIREENPWRNKNIDLETIINLIENNKLKIEDIAIDTRTSHSINALNDLINIEKANIEQQINTQNISNREKQVHTSILSSFFNKLKTIFSKSATSTTTQQPTAEKQGSVLRKFMKPSASQQKPEDSNQKQGSILRRFMKPGNPSETQESVKQIFNQSKKHLLEAFEKNKNKLKYSN